MDKTQNNNGHCTDRMTVKMASDVRGVSQRTIRRWVSTGRLKAVKTDGQWMIEPNQPNGQTDGHHKDRMADDDRTDTIRTLTANLDRMAEQLATKDQQIERLQSALDQSQQLQALAESRHQAEQQQLAEIRGRSLLQRLKAVLVANP